MWFWIQVYFLNKHLAWPYLLTSILQCKECPVNPTFAGYLRAKVICTSEMSSTLGELQHEKPLQTMQIYCEKPAS